MTTIVDWVDVKYQIESSCNMTDTQIIECLLALKHAKKIYTDLSNIPQRIQLTDSNNRVLHVIITNNTNYRTVNIAAEKSIFNYPLIATIGIAICLFIYYI